MTRLPRPGSLFSLMCLVKISEASTVHVHLVDGELDAVCGLLGHSAVHAQGLADSGDEKQRADASPDAREIRIVHRTEGQEQPIRARCSGVARLASRDRDGHSVRSTARDERERRSREPAQRTLIQVIDDLEPHGPGHRSEARIQLFERVDHYRTPNALPMTVQGPTTRRACLDGLASLLACVRANEFSQEKHESSLHPDQNASIAHIPDAALCRSRWPRRQQAVYTGRKSRT